MGANTRVKADAVDNLLCVQSLHLGISIQFVEVANTQSQVGVSEKLNSFCLSEAHKQGIDIFLNSTFLQ